MPMNSMAGPASGFGQTFGAQVVAKTFDYLNSSPMRSSFAPVDQGGVGRRGCPLAS
ncbi:hypothetical protein [Desulfohalovibrio reitneri]|uniref:hypothetical protein n=1 Tax=Desulfohalovibrio reitneri TaxID=1307759 RepID=UPI00137770B8|nr:hypothetical protein [Desulfohalovibrio reitneri]